MELSEARTTHDVPVLRVSGEVDLGSAGALRAAVEDLLARPGGLTVLDLSEVTFLDSAGLKVLDDMQQQAGEADGTVALVCPEPRILRLLEITGLSDRFPIHATPEDAAASERNGA